MTVGFLGRQGNYTFPWNFVSHEPFTLLTHKHMESPYPWTYQYHYREWVAYMLWGRYGLWKSCNGDGDHDTLLLVQVPAIFLLWAQASSVGLKKTLNSQFVSAQFTIIGQEKCPQCTSGVWELGLLTEWWYPVRREIQSAHLSPLQSCLAIMPHIMEEMGDLGFILWTEYSFRNGVSVHADLHVVFFKNL